MNRLSNHFVMDYNSYITKSWRFNCESPKNKLSTWRRWCEVTSRSHLRYSLKMHPSWDCIIVSKTTYDYRWSDNHKLHQRLPLFFHTNHQIIPSRLLFWTNQKVWMKNSREWMASKLKGWESHNQGQTHSSTWMPPPT